MTVHGERRDRGDSVARLQNLIGAWLTGCVRSASIQ